MGGADPHARAGAAAHTRGLLGRVAGEGVEQLQLHEVCHVSTAVRWVDQQARLLAFERCVCPSEAAAAVRPAPNQNKGPQLNDRLFSAVWHTTACRAVASSSGWFVITAAGVDGPSAKRSLGMFQGHRRA